MIHNVVNVRTISFKVSALKAFLDLQFKNSTFIIVYYTHFCFRFLKAGMNIVDLLGILPYFASLILSLVMTATARGQATANYQEMFII